MRVLIDTNVLISYLLLSGKEGAIRVIIRAFEKGRFTLLLPEPVLQELITTVRSKRRLSIRISPGELKIFTIILTTYAERLRELEESIPKITRDAKDDYLVAYALVGRADYLVTGDKDLLVLSGQIPRLEIVTPAQFAQILSAGFER